MSSSPGGRINPLWLEHFLGESVILPESRIQTLNSKRAFTLVELLVTIAIIGILAAWLLTGVNRVRFKAQRTHCLNNVKQLALGSFMYASDNSRHAGIETAAFPGGNWMGTLNDYACKKGILMCPSAPLHE